MPSGTRCPCCSNTSDQSGSCQRVTSAPGLTQGGTEKEGDLEEGAHRKLFKAFPNDDEVGLFAAYKIDLCIFRKRVLAERRPGQRDARENANSARELTFGIARSRHPSSLTRTPRHTSVCIAHKNMALTRARWWLSCRTFRCACRWALARLCRCTCHPFALIPPLCVWHPMANSRHHFVSSIRFQYALGDTCASPVNCLNTACHPICLRYYAANSYTWSTTISALRCVTFRRVAVPLRGPGQPPVLPFACCVGLLRCVGRCGRCSCWRRFRVRGAQWLVCRGCAGCGGCRPPPPPQHTARFMRSSSALRFPREEPRWLYALLTPVHRKCTFDGTTHVHIHLSSARSHPNLRSLQKLQQQERRRSYGG